jgi:hypothetical protein
MIIARARQDVLANYHPHMVAETVLQQVEAALFLKYEDGLTDYFSE